MVVRPQCFQPLLPFFLVVRSLMVLLSHQGQSSEDVSVPSTLLLTGSRVERQGFLLKQLLIIANLKWRFLF